MINKKELEKLLNQFVVKGSKDIFVGVYIDEMEDKSVDVEIEGTTCNSISMYHSFVLEKEDLKDKVSCLEAISKCIDDCYDNWDMEEEFEYGYQDEFYHNHPFELAHILEDYDERLYDATQSVCAKIDDYLCTLSEKQEEENRDDQR